MAVRSDSRSGCTLGSEPEHAGRYAGTISPEAAVIRTTRQAVTPGSGRHPEGFSPCISNGFSLYFSFINPPRKGAM